MNDFSCTKIVHRYDRIYWAIVRAIGYRKMENNDKWMTTQEVAELLGLSVSTVKRLVENGELVAEKTPGGHRRISSVALDKYTQRKGTITPRILPVTIPDRVIEPVVTEKSIDYWRDFLRTALLNAKVEEARHSIRTLHGAMGSAAELADRLIAPVMTQIGHGWQTGDLEIYQEHMASHMLVDLLFDLVRQARSRNARSAAEPGGAHAIGATPEGDHYTLTGILCELCLLEQGWSVRNLGSHLPLTELSHAITELRPGIAWLSVHFLEDATKFELDLRLVLETSQAMRTRLVVGGRAITESIRQTIVDHGAIFADDMCSLVRIAQEIRPSGRSAIEPEGKHHRSLHESR
jgi:excisionase family DNA binding protein